MPQPNSEREYQRRLPKNTGTKRQENLKMWLGAVNSERFFRYFSKPKLAEEVKPI